QFAESSELGTLNASQFPFVQGTGLFINQPSGDVAPVGLGATTLYTGLYATDTLDVTSRLSVTAGGRYNFAQINLSDALGNDALLNGSHTYQHFNPMIGATYKLTPNLTFYGDFAVANRAPTPLELACADPMRPCLIDNALVGDPNLQQVVSYTFEGGFRGQFNVVQGVLNWSVGGYRWGRLWQRPGELSQRSCQQRDQGRLDGWRRRRNRADAQLERQGRIPFCQPRRRVVHY